MGVGQELTNGLKGVGHVFSLMLKQKKSPPPPHINNDRSLNMAFAAYLLESAILVPSRALPPFVRPLCEVFL